jgi:hypothetical protein
MFSVCVCSLSYPACKAHAPYYIVICGLFWLFCIFRHYLINGTIFGKKLLNIKCMFWFSLQLLSETFLILTIIQRDTIINVHRSSCKVPLLLSDFKGTWIFSTYFRKISKYQISWKSFQRAESLYADGREYRRKDGRTDRQTDRKLIVTYRNFWNSFKNFFVKILSVFNKQTAELIMLMA